MIKVRFGLPSFRPTYENIKIAKDIFLSECPGKKYKSGNYSRIPVMLGFTNAETLAFTSRKFIHHKSICKVPAKYHLKYIYFCQVSKFFLTQSTMVKFTSNR